MSHIIIFDGQIFQTGAWHRGMGKYSLCLVDSMLKELQNDDVFIYLVFTKNLTLSQEAKSALVLLGRRVKHVYLDLAVPSSYDVTAHISNRSANMIILDDFIDATSKPKDSVKYIILSLFIDEVCEVFPSKTENILLFYDLIPLLYYKYYGIFSAYSMYLAQFKPLMLADKIMTISQTVADDLSGFIGIPKVKLCNIDGGPIKRGHIKAVKPNAFAVPDNFLLMSTGNDMRKNNARAVQGFEEYRISNNNSDVYLIISSTFDEATQKDLLSYSENLIFTGNIPEEELLWLYKHMVSLLFIPESEGLGLPILEAVEAKKPIVCSKIGPFFEMSENAFYYANHFDVADIADTIAEAMSGYQWSEKLGRYQLIIDKYTWDRTAHKALSFINQPAEVKKLNKPKLAIVGPDPSGYSAIGNKMQQAHPALSEYFDVEYYIEKQKTGSLQLRPSYLEYVASCRLVEQFDAAAYAGYDAVMYHIGNSEFHLETIKRALYLPGYVAVHDTYLNGAYSAMYTLNFISEKRYKAEERLDELLKSSRASRLGSLLNNQLGIFVHSDYAKKSIDNLGLKNLNIAKTVLCTEVPMQKIPRLSPKIRIGLAGIIHPIKGMDIIKRMAQQPGFENVQFEVFGMAMASQEDIDNLTALPNVNVSTNITDYEFQLKLAQLDILVNYRAEYHGETSQSVIDAMRVGVVPVVRDIGWFSELPDDVAIKLKSADKLSQSILALVLNPDQLMVLSSSAKLYAQNTFTYDKYVHDVVSMLSASIEDQGEKQAISTALKAGDTEKVLGIVQQDGL